MKLSNHSSITIEYSGEVQLQEDLTLPNILYVPAFRFNIIPISSLLSKHKDYSANFFHDQFTIHQDRIWIIAGKREQGSSLYIFKQGDKDDRNYINQVSIEV